jgi:DnaJ-class molecular chaperone
MDEMTCLWCDGEGSRSKRECSACHGSGRHTTERALRLMVELLNDMGSRIGDLETVVGRMAEEWEGMPATRKGGFPISAFDYGETVEEYLSAGRSRKHFRR